MFTVPTLPEFAKKLALIAQDQYDQFHQFHENSEPLDLFKNKKNQQVNLFPASGGWILDILNP